MDLQFWGTVYITCMGIFIAACMWYIRELLQIKSCTKLDISFVARFESI